MVCRELRSGKDSIVNISTRIIGIGEYAISNCTGEVLKTYALSSCVALTVYEPIKKVLGMVHIVLPGRGEPVSNPWYYADSAIPMLIQKICMGYECKMEDLEIRLYGGAQSICKKDVFNIGLSNIEKIKSVLERMKLKVCFDDTGGNTIRSISADVATGTVKVEYQPLYF